MSEGMSRRSALLLTKAYASCRWTRPTAPGGYSTVSINILFRADQRDPSARPRPQLAAAVRRAQPICAVRFLREQAPLQEVEDRTCSTLLD
jgi:hypothetical protein